MKLSQLLMIGAFTVFSPHIAAAGDRPVVVELFTSQGCSSCPPANAFLNELVKQRADVLALAFHVTYWDYLGWKDPFSMQLATDRQARYGQRFGDGSYTPEIVVDGAVGLVGSDRANVSAAIAHASGMNVEAPVSEVTAALARHGALIERSRRTRGNGGGRTMQGSLGEKIGVGSFADVHAWAPGRVLKLSKPGIPRRVVWHEARMTRAVFAAGAPAPEVFGEVTLEGRFGIVLGRLDGPTLLQHYRSGAVTFEQAGAILATLAMSVHKTPPPPDVPSLRDYMHETLRHYGGTLPNHIATGIRALIERLSPGDGLCHGDIHPDNVIMTAEGPRLIDWITTTRAPAAFDLARIHVGLSEIAPEIVDNPERPRAVNAAAQSGYARLAGMSPAALAAAIEPYLPIARVVVLLGGPLPALREWLIQRVEADLRVEN